MFSLESWQEIFETMLKNKLQTFLTMVSVFFGIFILVILVGFSSGIEKGVKSQFEEDATNRILEKNISILKYLGQFQL